MPCGRRSMNNSWHSQRRSISRLRTFDRKLFAVGSIEQKDDIAREHRVENNLLVSVSDVECVVIE